MWCKRPGSKQSWESFKNFGTPYRTPWQPLFTTRWNDYFKKFPSSSIVWNPGIELALDQVGRGAEDGAAGRSSPWWKESSWHRAPSRAPLDEDVREAGLRWSIGDGIEAIEGGRWSLLEVGQTSWQAVLTWWSVKPSSGQPVGPRWSSR